MLRYFEPPQPVRGFIPVPVYLWYGNTIAAIITPDHKHTILCASSNILFVMLYLAKYANRLDVMAIVRRKIVLPVQPNILSTATPRYVRKFTDAEIAEMGVTFED